VRCAHWKIKDHPEVFLEPTAQEQKSKMPSSAEVDANGGATVLIEESKEATDDADAIAAAAVVDASVTATPVDAVVPPTEEQTAAAEAVVSATMVSDPTSHLVDGSIDV
jgi:hypothetical protein